MRKTFAIAIAGTLLVLTGAVFFPGFFRGIDARWVDGYFKIRGPQTPHADIVLVTIDEKSINTIGRWPWPRGVMARLVDKLAAYGVKTAGFDITFSEKSGEDGKLASSLRNLPGAFLGYFFYLTPEEAKEAHLNTKERAENDATIYPSRLSVSSRQLASSGRKVFGVQTNVPEITESLGGGHQGFFNIFPDPDGVIRKSPLALFYKGGVYPSLALQITSFAEGFSPVPIYDESGALEGLSLGDKKIPLLPSGEFFINYLGPARTFLHVSAADVLEGKISPGLLKDKIVLIGATAIGIYDMRVTPMDANYPGLEISANIIDNILSRNFLAGNAITEALSVGLVIAVGFVLWLFLPRLSALGGFFFFLAAMLLLVGADYYLFWKERLIIYPFKPVLNGFLVYGGITIYRYFAEERERRKIRKTFQFYLSPAIIKQLLEHPERLKLGGERKELTVLFSDIRGFTTKSEKMGPETLVALLNDFFTEMTDVVFRHEGTLDKYMGDAIMAFFGAPVEQKDHALRGALTALEIAERLKKQRKIWCAKYGIDDLQIGVGLHTGTMVVGNMGSSKRFNYTVIGDAVNLASRLEGLNKDYGTQILVSEDHYERVKDHVTARKIGPALVKGKTESVVVYELLGKKS